MKRVEKQVLSLIEEKKYTRLRECLEELNPADIAMILEEAELKDLPVVFRILPKELAAEVFVEMDRDLQQHLIESFSNTDIIGDLDAFYIMNELDIENYSRKITYKEKSKNEKNYFNRRFYPSRIRQICKIGF